MKELRSNEPLDKILRYRESGYVDKLVEGVLAGLEGEWDFYLYFELSRWKGADLQLVPNGRRKAVLCVGDESSRTNYPFLADVDIMFRTYLPENQKGKIFHVPVGPSQHFVPGPFVPWDERPQNVFFSGNLHQGRAGLYKAFTRMPALPFALLHRLRPVLGERFDHAFPRSTIRFSTGFHNGIAPEEYARVVGESKIALCPAGIENPESMRHFEAGSLGCIVVTTPMPKAEVYTKAPFVILSSWRELKSTVNKLLREPNQMLDLHHQTLEWWQTTARPEAVTSMMLNRLHNYSI